MSAALVALSCAKELADPQEATGNENITYKTITFESIATKTTLDGVTGNVAWEEGDQISIYYVNEEGKPAETVATAASAAATTTFSAQIPETENPEAYYAAYPKGKGQLTVTTDEESGTTSTSFAINVTGNSCDGTFKSANFAAAYTTAESMSLAFKNAVGIIKLELPESGSVFHGDNEFPITGVYVRCKANSIKLNGLLAVSVANDKVADFANANGGGNISMTKLSGAALESGEIYMPCTPAAWPDGICVRYISSAGEVPAVLTQDKTVEVTRGHILTIPELSAKIVWDYYVSVNGGGDGLTEANPMTLAQMQTDYLDKAASTIAACFVLNGTTLHMVKDTYSLESPLKFYPGKDVSSDYKMTVEGNGAVLDGGNATRVVEIGNFTHLDIRDITIQNGSSTDGAGVDVQLASTTTDENFTLDFLNCTFSGNNATGNGGAICADGSSGGIIRFDNCNFTNNKARNGTSGNGGAFYADGKLAAFFNKSSFITNLSGKNGMTIYMNSASTRLGMNNCTVKMAANAGVGDGYGSNTSAVTNKGYTVIANSTIWSSGKVGKWGMIALGSNNKQNGSLILNSFIRNKGLPAFYFNAKYYQNVKFTIYSGSFGNVADYAEDGVTVETPAATLGKTYWITDSYDYGSTGTFGGTPANIGNNNPNLYNSGVAYQSYTWSWASNSEWEFTFPTLQQVKDEISATAEIGPKFLAWLETLDRALTTDIAGNSRNEMAMCPGSYQQVDTPVPAN